MNRSHFRMLTYVSSLAVMAGAVPPLHACGEGDLRAVEVALPARVAAEIEEVRGQLEQQWSLRGAEPCFDRNAREIIAEAERELAKAVARNDRGDHEAALDDVAEAREELLRLASRLAKLER